MALSYIICGTPRSGSTLLCDLLAATGIAGRPASFYREQSIAGWAKRLGIAHDPASGPDFDRRYLDAILDAGRGGTSVFGLRLMRESLAGLVARLTPLCPPTQDEQTLLEHAFGPLMYVHLSRSDKVAQAISLVRALQTGLWHVASNGSERERTAPPQPPRYDESLIHRYVTELEADDTDWARWFAKEDIRPLSLTYESLSAKPGAGLARLLAAIGLDPAAAAGTAPRTSRMADGESIEWARRYRDSRAAGRS